MAESGRVGGSLVDQQYRNVIAHGVDAVAGIALKGFGVGLEDERLLAGGTNQDFEEIRGNHNGDCTPKVVQHGVTKGGELGKTDLVISASTFRMHFLRVSVPPW